jgi:hypothetical protein
MDWKRPEIVEIKMDAEIGSYQEDGDPMPLFTGVHSRASSGALGKELLGTASYVC